MITEGNILFGIRIDSEKFQKLKEAADFVHGDAILLPVNADGTLFILIEPKKDN